MSHYVECKPGFKDQQVLIEALVAIGFDRSQIELHEEAVPLYGYRGDERFDQDLLILGLTGETLKEQPDLAEKLSQACAALKQELLDPNAVSSLTGRLKRRVVLD